MNDDLRAGATTQHHLVLLGHRLATAILLLVLSAVLLAPPAAALSVPAESPSLSASTVLPHPADSSQAGAADSDPLSYIAFAALSMGFVAASTGVIALTVSGGGSRRRTSTAHDEHDHTGKND